MCFIASQLEKDHLFFACCMAPYEIIRTERRAFSRSQIALGIVETYLQPAGTQGNVNPVSCPCVSLPLCDKPDAQTRNDHGVNRVGAFLLQVKCRRELSSSTLDKPSDPSIWGKPLRGFRGTCRSGRSASPSPASQHHQNPSQHSIESVLTSHKRCSSHNAVCA